MIVEMVCRRLVVSLVLAFLSSCSDGASPVDAGPRGGLVVDSAPSATGNSPNAMFAFHADGADHFACQLDAGPAGTCTSPYSVTVGDGSHILTITAYAGADVFAEPAVITWLVDTTAPDTMITASPATYDNSTTTQFAFVGIPAADTASFTCSLDGAAFAACTSPTTITTVAGDHTFDVRAGDVLNNVDPTPAHWAWTIDDTVIDTTITAGPAMNSSTQGSVSFTFTSTDPLATFECQIDTSLYAPCQPPAAFVLSEGLHTFAVRSRRGANVDPTPATRTWTVDTTPPTVTITSFPHDPTNNTTPTFAFSSPDLTATFECQIDGATTYAPCSSPWTSPSLSDGPRTFRVRTTDTAANFSTAAYSWTQKTAAPVITINSMPANGATNPTATFSFSSSDPQVTFECEIDGVVAYTACTSPWSQVVPGGSQTFHLRGTDAATNQTVKSWTWMETLPGPTVTITGGPSTVPPANLPDETFTFSTTGSPTMIDCSLDGAPYVPCSSPVAYSGLADGDHDFIVRVRDSSLNSATAARAFTIATATCTQHHHICSGAWCQVVPVPTLGDFTNVYAVKGANEAWAINPAYGQIYHFDSCGWSLVYFGTATTTTPIAASNRINVVFGAGLRWDGAQLQPAPSGNAVAAIDSSNDWSGCNRWDGITWTNYGCTPTAIGAVSKDDVWLGDATGALWHWDGSTFSSHASPTGNRITTIAAFDATHVWIGTALDSYVWNGTTFTYSGAPGDPAAPPSVHDYWNGNEHWDGTAWTTFGLCPSSAALAVSYDSTTQGWCVGTNGFVSTWNGASWTDYLNNDRTFRPPAFFPVNDTDQYLGGTVTHPAELFHGDGNIDGVWTSLGAIPYPSDGVSSPATTRSVFSAGGGDVWTLGSQGGSYETPVSHYLLHYQGGSWTTVRQTTGAYPLHDIKGSGPNDVWIAFGSELLHWDGVTTATTLSGTFRALWSPGANRIWALSSTLNVFDGTSWSTLPTPTGNGGANSLWGSSETDVWAVDNSTFTHWNGTMWTFPNHSAFPSAQSVWGTSATDVFFTSQVSVSATIGHFDGTTFTIEPSVPPESSGNPPFPGSASFINGDPVHRRLWFVQTIQGVQRFAPP